MRRILVVDDNEDAAASLAALLELSGNEVRTAHDGIEAIATLDCYRADTVFLDIGLPKMSGYDVCRAIRARPAGGDVQVIALTGRGQNDDRRRSAEAGFDAHLLKPVDLAALTNLLAAGFIVRRGSAA